MEYFVANVSMIISKVEEGIVLMEKYLVIDHVCHGREESELDLFFMYETFFIDVHVHLPFDEFIMGCCAS